MVQNDGFCRFDLTSEGPAGCPNSQTEAARDENTDKAGSNYRQPHRCPPLFGLADIVIRAEYGRMIPRQEEPKDT